jgi:hypothetical protein
VKWQKMMVSRLCGHTQGKPLKDLATDRESS